MLVAAPGRVAREGRQVGTITYEGEQVPVISRDAATFDCVYVDQVGDYTIWRTTTTPTSGPATLFATDDAK